jgi:ATP-dependent exoDNAse (exonuclease V) alpha subunit
MNLTLPEKYSFVDLSDEHFSKTLDLILNTNQNLNIIGPAGCGKSLMIRMCSDLLGSGTVFCSTTGISAVNISQEGVKATTLHSFFRLKPLPYYPPTFLKEDKKFRDVISAVKTIVIDEASMMSSHMFDTLFFLIRMYKSVSNFPRIILFSDILQLPPVVSFNNKDVLEMFEKDYGKKIMFFNAKHFPQLEFKTIHLNKLYRQKNSDFQAVLNRMREGVHTKDDLAYVNRFAMPLEKYDKNNEFYSHLVTTNKQADMINENYLINFGYDEEFKFYRQITGTVDQTVLKNIDECVRLKCGLQVMCLKNNREQEYQNGTVGKIVSMNQDLNDQVTIQTKDGNELTVVREEWSNFEYEKNKDGELQVIEKGKITQIGCKLAKSLTVHRSQGLTLDNLYFDPSKYVFSPALTYVALSRIRDVNNIGLARPLKMDDIRASREALEFLEKAI